MELDVRGVSNWIVYYLARGGNESDLRVKFTDEFGMVDDSLWNAAFRVAAIGEANAANFATTDVRSKLKNAFDLPGGDYSTVQVRALLTFTYTDPVTGRLRIDNAVVQHDFSYNDRVADVIAWFSGYGRSGPGAEYGTLTNIQIIPGLYLPG